MAKKIAKKKVTKTAAPIVSSVGNAAAMASLKTASPMADRCLSRVSVLQEALAKIETNLRSYQDPRSAKDLDVFVETTLRMSLESIAAIVMGLNCPVAYFPKTQEQKDAEQQAEYDRRLQLFVKNEELKNVNSARAARATKRK